MGITDWFCTSLTSGRCSIWTHSNPCGFATVSNAVVIVVYFYHEFDSLICCSILQLSRFSQRLITFSGCLAVKMTCRKWCIMFTSSVVIMATTISAQCALFLWGFHSFFLHKNWQLFLVVYTLATPQTNFSMTIFMSALWWGVMCTCTLRTLNNPTLVVMTGHKLH